jgi:hypothetical protein
MSVCTVLIVLQCIFFYSCNAFALCCCADCCAVHPTAHGHVVPPNSVRTSCNRGSHGQHARCMLWCKQFQLMMSPFHKLKTLYLAALPFWRPTKRVYTLKFHEHTWLPSAKHRLQYSNRCLTVSAKGICCNYNNFYSMHFLLTHKHTYTHSEADLLSHSATNHIVPTLQGLKWCPTPSARNLLYLPRCRFPLYHWFELLLYTSWKI